MSEASLRAPDEGATAARLGGIKGASEGSSRRLELLIHCLHYTLSSCSTSCSRKLGVPSPTDSLVAIAVSLTNLHFESNRRAFLATGQPAAVTD